MRVLHVIPTLEKGGAERLVLDLARAHKNEFNVDVKIVVLNRQNDYVSLSQDLDVSFIASNIEFSLVRKNRVNISVYERLVDEFKPDIIHSHLIKAELVSKYNIRKGVKYITHWHGYHDQTNALQPTDFLTKAGIAKWFFVWKLRLIYARSPRVSFLAISNHIKGYVMDRLSVSSKRITVIYNGFDDVRFKPAESTPPRDVFNLISMGSFHPIKAQHFLIEVMKIIKSRGHNNLRLTLVGDGPLRKQLQQLVKDNDVEDLVRFAGLVNDPEKYLHQSHLYVHSAILEGFGLVIVEAMGSGLPVVVTNGGGNAEIIQNNHDGYVIENRDANEFANKVIYLSENREVYDQFSKNSYESSKKFAIKKFSDNIYKYYQQILA